MTTIEVDEAALELREELRAVTRQVLAERSPSGAVRALLDDPLGYERALWRTAAELGWLGLEIPEHHGGAGMGFAELGVVLDEVGRAIAGLPVLSAVVLGAGAIAAAGTDAQQATWLPAIASGDARVTAALAGRSSPPGHRDTAVTAEPNGDGWRLRGEARFVPDVLGADAIVTIADTADGPLVLLVPTATRGVDVAWTPTYDQTRRLGSVRFDGARLPADAVLAPPGGAEPLIAWLLDRASVALALDAHGGARRMLEVSVDYAKERIQFDRPIGSFQAVKHRCADMLVAVESARVAAEAAARAMPTQPGQPSMWASMAASYACDAYARVAGDAVMVHGGIGFTWEHDAHLHLKRAKLSQSWFGTSSWHRQRVCRLRVGST